ncbi:MAG TPA: serine/threonine-protein kinase [Burkholderiales bacterium]|nr:serine/threonine-protein kinase [Burkholderiales bacterium]
MEELKTLGRYQIQGVLGKGAMGLVYDGRDPNLDRRVAIKTILTRKLDAEAARMITVRFEREVRAVARLNHRHIVQVYDFGAEGDLAYIVMEFIQGKELKDSFDANHRFDLKTTFRIMLELLDALEFAHEAGIVHRDIKPGNVMVDAAGHAKLCDFGVARVTEPSDQAEATRAGALVGTPSYMSPEQIQGQKVDRRSDIFSAGIIFYQFLTGQKPFEGSQFALQQKIVMEDPVWPSAIVQVPPEFDRVIARALAKDVEQRYQSARSFADALKRILAGKAPEDPDEVLSRPLPAMPSAAPSAQDSEAEAEFWEDVKDSEDPEDLKLYLEQFPRGKFVEQAKHKIAALGGEGG